MAVIYKEETREREKGGRGWQGGNYAYVIIAATGMNAHGESSSSSRYQVSVGEAPDWNTRRRTAQLFP